MRFVGFTFKKASDDSKIKNIVSLFDEIEQARDKKKNMKLEATEPAENSKISTWQQTISLNFPSSPKSPRGDLQPTLMVSPRKETSIKLPITIKATSPSTQDKKYTINTQPISQNIPPETSKKTKENSEIGKMLYMGGYKKGQLGFQRSSSNGPNNPQPLKPGVSLKDTMGSPRKTNGPQQGDTPSSNRKTQGLTEIRKNDFLVQNLMVSPTSQAAAKKKGFGFLGLKFLSKNKG